MNNNVINYLNNINDSNNYNSSIYNSLQLGYINYYINIGNRFIILKF